MDAFISYSHRDAEALERLHVHLATLRRDGLISTWYDRDILAGDVFDEEIAERLETSGLFLLLVTPDFLASDYCVERETRRALERHAAGEARVIPIIVEPCDWRSTPLAGLKAVPRDGRAVSDWTNPNSAYLDVVQEIRRAIEGRAKATGDAAPQAEAGAAAPAGGPARRYRAKRDFDEIDRSEFREAAFAAVRDYFRKAVEELDGLDDFRGRFREFSPTSFGCTIVNRARDRGTAHLTVHMRAGDRFGLGDIYYSFEQNAGPNGAHGAFTVDQDEYELFLTGNFGWTGGDRQRLDPHAAAESLWEQVLEQAGITHA